MHIEVIRIGPKDKRVAFPSVEYPWGLWVLIDTMVPCEWIYKDCYPNKVGAENAANRFGEHGYTHAAIVHLQDILPREVSIG